MTAMGKAYPVSQQNGGKNEMKRSAERWPLLEKEFESLELPHAVAILSNPLDVCRAKTLFCKITFSGNGYLCQSVEMSTLHE